MEHTEAYVTAQRELYESFQNLEEVKASVASEELDPEVAFDLERNGRARKSYLAYLGDMTRGVAPDQAGAGVDDDSSPDWLDAQPEPTPAPEPVKAEPAPPAPDTQAKVEAAIRTRDEVLKRLKKAERNYMLQKERVRNPALPQRPDEVRDWFPEMAYFWVPAPPKTRDFHPLEHQNIDKFLRAGWEFYPSEEMEANPNPRGLPWHPSAERDGSKVRWSDHWLMYRSAEYEARARKDALKKWNSKREARKGPQGEGFVGTAYEGVSTVDKILRESQDDEQDRNFLPR